MLNETVIKYYNDSGLGVVGVYPQHQDGDFTFLLSRSLKYSWIRTEDLKDTRGEAEKSLYARFE
jgi:hypothetical protein